MQRSPPQTSEDQCLSSTVPDLAAEFFSAEVGVFDLSFQEQMAETARLEAASALRDFAGGERLSQNLSTGAQESIHEHGAMRVNDARMAERARLNRDREPGPQSAYGVAPEAASSHSVHSGQSAFPGSVVVPLDAPIDRDLENVNANHARMLMRRRLRSRAADELLEEERRTFANYTPPDEDHRSQVDPTPHDPRPGPRTRLPFVERDLLEEQERRRSYERAALANEERRLAAARTLHGISPESPQYDGHGRMFGSLLERRRVPVTYRGLTAMAPSFAPQIERLPSRAHLRHSPVPGLRRHRLPGDAERVRAARERAIAERRREHERARQAVSARSATTSNIPQTQSIPPASSFEGDAFRRTPSGHADRPSRDSSVASQQLRRATMPSSPNVQRSRHTDRRPTPRTPTMPNLPSGRLQRFYPDEDEQSQLFSGRAQPSPASEYPSSAFAFAFADSNSALSIDQYEDSMHPNGPAGLIRPPPAITLQGSTLHNNPYQHSINIGWTRNVTGQLEEDRSRAPNSRVAEPIHGRQNTTSIFQEPQSYLQPRTMEPEIASDPPASLTTRQRVAELLNGPQSPIPVLQEPHPDSQSRATEPETAPNTTDSPNLSQRLAELRQFARDQYRDALNDYHRLLRTPVPSLDSQLQPAVVYAPEIDDRDQNTDNHESDNDAPDLIPDLVSADDDSDNIPNSDSSDTSTIRASPQTGPEQRQEEQQQQEPPAPLTLRQHLTNRYYTEAQRYSEQLYRYALSLYDEDFQSNNPHLPIFTYHVNLYFHARSLLHHRAAVIYLTSFIRAWRHRARDTPAVENEHEVAEFAGLLRLDLMRTQREIWREVLELHTGIDLFPAQSTGDETESEAPSENDEGGAEVEDAGEGESDGAAREVAPGARMHQFLASNMEFRSRVGSILDAAYEADGESMDEAS